MVGTFVVFFNGVMLPLIIPGFVISLLLLIVLVAAVLVDLTAMPADCVASS